MGAADARIRTEGRGRVIQAPTPSGGHVGHRVGELDTDDAARPRPTYAPSCGDDARSAADHRAAGHAPGSDDRVIDFSTTGVDLTDPLTEGLFEPRERAPARVRPARWWSTTAMLAKGLAVGDDARRRPGATLTRRRGRRRTPTIRDHPGRARGRPTTSRPTRRQRRASGWSRPARCRGRPCSTSTRSGAIVTSRVGAGRPARRRVDWPSRWATTPASDELLRGRRPDHRDGPDRGRPAGRTGLRRRRPPARPHARPDRRLAAARRPRRGG